MSVLLPRRIVMAAAATLLVGLSTSDGAPAQAQTVAASRPQPLAPRTAIPTAAPIVVAQATPPKPRPARPRTYARPAALATVQSANSSARELPSAGAYVNAALYYDYEPG